MYLLFGNKYPRWQTPHIWIVNCLLFLITSAKLLYFFVIVIIKVSNVTCLNKYDFYEKKNIFFIFKEKTSILSQRILFFFTFLSQFCRDLIVSWKKMQKKRKIKIWYFTCIFCIFVHFFCINAKFLLYWNVKLAE